MVERQTVLAVRPSVPGWAHKSQPTRRQNSLRGVLEEVKVDNCQLAFLRARGAHVGQRNGCPLVRCTDLLAGCHQRRRTNTQSLQERASRRVHNHLPGRQRSRRVAGANAAATSWLISTRRCATQPSMGSVTNWSPKHLDTGIVESRPRSESEVAPQSRTPTSTNDAESSKGAA